MPIPLSIAEFTRNFAHYVERVLRRHEQFILLHEGRPVAELRPLPSGRRLGDLPGILERLPVLSKEEAAAFEADLERARTELANVPVRDPWAI